MPLPPNVEDVYPLSPLQHGLLFHTLLDPQGGNYVVQLSGELASWIDPRDFCRAWQIMTEHHDVLRTAFLTEAPERPLQIVYRTARLAPLELDWRGITPEECETRLDHLMESDRRRGFVLTEAPLLRITIILIENHRHWLLLSFHHILWDGWSLTMILQELSRCCAAVSAGRVPPKLKRRPFRDYIEWMHKQDRAAAEAFWREELRGLTDPSPLGIERVQSTECSSVSHLSLSISPDEQTSLASFARLHKLTLNTLVQGAWAIVLARYSGNKDVVFGGTVSGRPSTLEGADSMLGMFLNTIPVRVLVSENAVLADWLSALQSRQLRAREYDFCQLAEIQRLTSGSRAAHLLDSIVDFKNFPSNSAVGEPDRSLFAGPVRSYEQTGYPLTLTVSLQPQVLIEADFDSARYDPATISRVLGQLRTLLAGMPRFAARTLSDLSLLGPAEMQKIESWSNGSVRRLRNSVFQQDFERCTERAPQAIAVATAHGDYSYADLNSAANRLARHLSGIGVGPEKFVGVCLERSFELVVACVAIQKLGAVYLPLDPAYPPERLSQFVRNAELAAMIVTSATAPRAPRVGAPVDLDCDQARIAALHDSNPPIGALHPRSLAYAIHTSGSTGAPRGAMVEFGGMLNHLDAKIGAFSLSPSDTIAQTAPTGFDISVWQILAPLIVGASIRIVSNDIALNPAFLIECVNRDGVTVLQLVPSLLRLLLEEEQASGRQIGPSLRWMITTGEAISPALALRWIEQHPDVPLLNAYGPAECSDDVTHGVLTPENVSVSSHVSIGKPLANTEIYVLDERMRLVPTGVAGELYIGGLCVGRGYLRDPGATARSFLPHPFAETPGERLYKTGDLVRWREDGDLEFLGRRDFQFKINGARIEAGDIEAALLRHDLIDHAIVDCSGEGGHSVLVAYITVTEEARAWSPDTLSRHLRTYLRDKLPRHMVPALFRILEEIPLNPNGKLDRDRLALSNEDSAPLYNPRRSLTPSEEVIAGIWSLVLRVPDVRPDDDLFELGGHSLSAMQIVARASFIFGRAISLRTLFDWPTLGEFAQAVERLGRDLPAADVLPLGAVPRNGPLPVSFSQRVLWMLAISHPTVALSNLPMALRLTGRLDETALAQAFGDVIEMHEPLRTRVRAEGNRLIQDIHPPAPFHLPVVDLTHHSRPEAEALAKKIASEDANWPFNPVLDPGLRAALLRISPQEQVLLITLNHLLADDVSCGVLVADLAQAYDARKAGLPSPLARLPFQFADYVAWLEKWTGSAEDARQEAYWRRQLSEPLAPLNLPSSRPRGESLSSRFRRRRRGIPEPLYRQLQRVAATLGATVFMLMLSVFKLFLLRWTGQHDVRVGTLMTIRNKPGMQQLIGPFVSTLVLRTDLSGNPRFSEVLARVQRTVVDAFANCDLPLDRMIAAAIPGRDLRLHPLIRAFFIFQQPVETEWNSGNLQATAFPVAETSGDEIEITSYELICEITARPSELDVVFRYNADLFDDSMIESFMVSYESLLACGSSDSRQRIDAILASTENSTRAVS